MGVHFNLRVVLTENRVGLYGPPTKTIILFKVHLTPFRACAAIYWYLWEKILNPKRDFIDLFDWLMANIDAQISDQTSKIPYPSKLHIPM